MNEYYIKAKKIKNIKIFILVNVILNILSMIATGIMLYLANRYMSFSGFGSLFILILIIPYFLVLIAIILLIMLSVKIKKNFVMVIALIMQIVSPIPYLFISYLFGGNISIFEFLMAMQIINGIIGLIMIAD